jgi:RNA-directed DNA polymerase
VTCHSAEHPCGASALRGLRFSRLHPGMRCRFAFLGFEFYWSVNRQGERRLMKRTARKKLGWVLKEFSDWVRTHRHLPTKALFRQVAWKLRGHFNPADTG